MAFISASIDFGTTYSGWAYSFKHDYEKDPTDVKAKHWPAHQFISSKAPTIIILRSDGTTVEAFGYEAETRYLQLIETNRHTEYFCFHFFKMTLYNEKNIGKHTLIKDIAGREMRALDVFASAMKWLKDDLQSALNDKYTGGIHLTDIHWVITVPAIWSETAKQFMRIAAREAGIEMGRLNLALEPEAASIFWRHTNMQRSETSSSVDMSKFPPGTRYAVCDAGGGTVDITVHEITSDNRLKEVSKASGGAFGGLKVNEAFEMLMDSVAGCDLIKHLKIEYMDDYLELMRTFELLKRDNGHDISNNVTFRIPSSVNEIVCKLTGSSLKEVMKNSVYDTHVSVVRDKLRFASNIIVALFKGPIGSIIEHLESIFINEDHNINTIVMVGGFSESKYLQQQIRLAFPDKQVIIPEEAGLAVLKGATMFGHNMRQIETRISRYTFGLALTTSFDVHAHPINRLVIEGPLKGKVSGLFSKLVEIGQALDANTCACTQIFVPQDGITYYDACLYASTSANPQFIDEPECFKIGSFVVNCTDQNGEVGSTTLWMYFGGTEIVVLAVHNISGLNTSAVFNLPE